VGALAQILAFAHEKMTAALVILTWPSTALLLKFVDE
jgi:esterase/lipase superfamily enzyme